MATKNTGDFHPELDNLKHHKGQPSASFPADADEAQNIPAALAKLSTEELRDRAGQLAIDGHLDMDRGALIQALLDFKSKLQ